MPAPADERAVAEHPDAVCRHCGHAGIRVVERLETVPPGRYSIAGAQTKLAARWWPYAICDGYGHTSRGAPT